MSIPASIHDFRVPDLDTILIDQNLFNGLDDADWGAYVRRLHQLSHASAAGSKKSTQKTSAEGWKKSADGQPGPTKSK